MKYLITDGFYTYGDQSGPATTNADLTGTVVAAPGVERPQPPQPVTTAYG